MGDIIQTKGLTKKYGKLVALDDLNLVVEEGAAFGFVGPNGAGKTTTMRILATLLRPTAGEAWVAGHSVGKERQAVRRTIGYMPDFFGVYGDMKVWEYLDFFAACYDIPPATRARLVDDLLELVDLAHRRDDYVDALSRGMKQRICLARALAHDPQLLILDEPASGLDPRARIEIRALLHELHAMGKTILISSHILSEIEEVCTHIGIIEAGRLIAAGSLDSIQEQLQSHRTLRIGLLNRIKEAAEWLAAQPEVLDVALLTEKEKSFLQLEFSGDQERLAQLLADLTRSGFAVTQFQETARGLEDTFMRLTQGIVT
ncbi:MAG: ABC transporter ATP-binding protein [Anaerolineae bacterium]|nr:ABC transporter ATP-binding protein [Anaerolineae bacterium]